MFNATLVRRCSLYFVTIPTKKLHTTVHTDKNGSCAASPSRSFFRVPYEFLQLFHQLHACGFLQRLLLSEHRERGKPTPAFCTDDSVTIPQAAVHAANLICFSPSIRLLIAPPLLCPFFSPSILTKLAKRTACSMLLTLSRPATAWKKSA